MVLELRSLLYVETLLCLNYIFIKLKKRLFVFLNALISYTTISSSNILLVLDSAFFEKGDRLIHISTHILFNYIVGKILKTIL